MNITIVADVLGKENNGTTVTIKRLISHLKARGHAVKVVSATQSDEEGYYTLPKRNFYIFNGYMQKNGVVLAEPDDDILRQAISGADVVHIVLPFRTGKHTVKLCKEMGIPFTTATHCQAENVTAHVGMKDFKLANDIVYRYMYETFYKDTRFVHCPSQTMANILREHGYNMDIRVISNGVEKAYCKKEGVARPAEWKDKFVVMFVGRLSREKMHKTLIKAVSLSRHKEDIQLVFAGDGPLKKRLQKMGGTLPNPPQIGFHPQAELVDLLNAADLYVHPSVAEIEAISCLEAISCGLVPVISDSKASATNQFALTEHNLFKNGDAKSLAEKIDFLIENPDILSELKEKYESFSKEYAIENCIDKMEKMFSDAAAYYKKENA